MNRLKFFNKQIFSIVNKGFCDQTSFKIKLSEDITTAKMQVLWRVRNFGQLELEVLVGRWIEPKINNMSMEELRLFTDEILEKEVVELDGYLLKNKDIPEGRHYTKLLKDYLYQH